MDIKSFTLSSDSDLCRQVLAELLERYLDPAFGALPKKEIDLLILNTLQSLGYVSDEPTLYDLVSRLRVTRSKARNLLYDTELRRLDTEALDGKLRIALKRPIMQKQAELFVLEIENPLVIDHLRARLQHLGHATDGSFSPSLVKVSLDALVALLEDYLSESQQEQARRALVRAGAPDTSLSGVLKATVRAIAGRFAREAGEAVVGRVSEFVTLLLDGVIDEAATVVRGIFAQSGPES